MKFLHKEIFFGRKNHFCTKKYVLAEKIIFAQKNIFWPTKSLAEKRYTIKSRKLREKRILFKHMFKHIFKIF